MYLDRQLGYMDVYVPQHPKARKGSGRVREHILVAEKALGRLLPEGVEVHHVNGVRSDNCTENLVICEDRAYHRLLHRRTEAYKESGNPEYRKCTHCQQWDDIVSLTFLGTTWRHPKCGAEACRAWRLRTGYKRKGMQ